MKELSEWQKLRVRDALRAYHRYGRDPVDKRHYIWKDVREAIVEYTGVNIGSSARHGAEILRKFVEGLEDKKSPDGWRHPVPQPKAVEAIVAFVTHDDLLLLTKDELEEYLPGYQAPLRLLEYMDDGSEVARLVPPAKLQGNYQLLGNDLSGVVVWQMSLERPTDQGLIQVTERQEHYLLGAQLNLKDWSPAQRRENCLCTIKHSGWAILTPEDNLLIYLKKQDDCRNRHYYTLAAITSLWEEDAPFELLVLLRQEFPLQLEPVKYFLDERVASQVKDGIGQKIMLFKKLPG